MSGELIAAIISGIINLILGFFGGYTYSNKNIQKAKNNVVQIQVGGINEKRK